MRAIIQRVSSASVTGEVVSLLPFNVQPSNGLISCISRRWSHFQDIKGPYGSCRHWNRSALRTCPISRYTRINGCIQNRWHRCWCNSTFEEDVSTKFARYLLWRAHTQFIYFSSLNLRVFDDPTTQKMWKASVKDIDGEILCVSQFTLMANTTKSNKPDFHRAMVSGCDFCRLNVFWFSSSQPSLHGNFTLLSWTPSGHHTNPTKLMVRSLPFYLFPFMVWYMISCLRWKVRCDDERQSREWGKALDCSKSTERSINFPKGACFFHHWVAQIREQQWLRIVSSIQSLLHLRIGYR